VASKGVKVIRSSIEIDTFFENPSFGVGGYSTHTVMMIPRKETRRNFLSEVKQINVGTAIHKYKRNAILSV
jgi:hypothetical protein